MFIFKQFARFFSICRIIAKYQIIPYDLIHYRFISFLLRIFFFFIAPFSYCKRHKKEYAHRILEAFKELGPIYIKFGQILSTRPDIIGLDIAKQLEDLQDKLPPSDFTQIESILKKEFGDIDQHFKSFNKKAVSAASIAEVFKAKLKTGEVVAVKVIKPGICKKYKQDITLFKFFAKIINYIFFALRRFNLQEIVSVLEKAMEIELNLNFEAAACSEIADNNIEEDIIIPKIYWELTSSNILVLEWIDGVSIKEINSLKNIDKKELAQRIALCFFNQAFRYGFFHADLHPGNILITKEGKIALIDFGITCRLAEKDRMAVASIFHGFFARDYKKVADIHVEVGYVPEGTDIGLFSLACRSVGEPIIGMPVHQISIGKLLGDLFYINNLFQMEIQPQLILLQKNMVMVEGMGVILDNNINMWNLIEPWIKSWAVHNITPEAKFIKAVKKRLKEILDV